MMSDKEKKLTRKQQAFITEYLIDFNATQAAIRAGYSERSANNIGPGNLLKPIIKAEIERQIAEKAMGKDEVLLTLGKFGRGEIDEQDTKDQLKALELLGKHYKMFTDKHEHTGEDGTPLQTLIILPEKQDDGQI